MRLDGFDINSLLYFENAKRQLWSRYTNLVVHLRCSESLEDLRMMYEKKERTIIRKQQTYKSFREKLDVS